MAESGGFSFIYCAAVLILSALGGFLLDSRANIPKINA
jgi:hypothetical protein